MKTTTQSQLWGIYYTDREYAREMGDPLRTVVEAPTEIAAEEQAARLGFGDPWEHPVTLDEAMKARWLPEWLQRRQVNQAVTGGIRV